MGEPDLNKLMENEEIRFSHDFVRELGFKSYPFHPLEGPPP
jgi:hypothetical protein